MVGRNFKGKTDINGKAFRDEIVAKAQLNKLLPEIIRRYFHD